MYTNTGKLGSIAGLIVTTVLVAYASQNATKIVDGTVAVAKDGIRKANEIIHGGKHQYWILERTPNGNLVNTGKKVWR